MPSRSRFLMLLVVTLATALAGCASHEAPDAGTETPADGNATAPDAAPPVNESAPPPVNATDENATTEEPAQPDDVRVREEGEFAGPFEDAWSWPVESNAFDAFTVSFNLSGASGTPATAARLHVRLVDAHGAVVREATVGLGGVPGVTWEIGVEDVRARGPWRLEATTPEDDAAPVAGGAARYAVAVDVRY